MHVVGWSLDIIKTECAIVNISKYSKKMHYFLLVLAENVDDEIIQRNNFERRIYFFKLMSRPGGSGNGRLLETKDCAQS